MNSKNFEEIKTILEDIANKFGGTFKKITDDEGNVVGIEGEIEVGGNKGEVELDIKKEECECECTKEPEIKDDVIDTHIDAYQRVKAMGLEELYNSFAEMGPAEAFLAFSRLSGNHKIIVEELGRINETNQRNVQIIDGQNNIIAKNVKVIQDLRTKVSGLIDNLDDACDEICALRAKVKELESEKQALLDNISILTR